MRQGAIILFVVDTCIPLPMGTAPPASRRETMDGMAPVRVQLWLFSLDLDSYR